MGVALAWLLRQNTPQVINTSVMTAALWIALRPFSFPASIIPVLLGAVTAVQFGGADLSCPNLLFSLIAMVLLQGASNVLNDIYDYRKGLDTEVLPVSGAVVRGLLTPRQAGRYAAALFGISILIGLYLALATSMAVLWIGLFGVAVGVLYSATAVGLKYRGFGDLSVFLNFGILGSLGSWTVQTGYPSWLPVLWSIPISLLVVAILHANNWRDASGDTGKGYRTVASMLGDSASELYYGLLIFAPYALVVFFAEVQVNSFPKLPSTVLITFASLPLALRLMRRARQRREPVRPMDFVALDGATAQLNLLFGILSVAGILAAGLS